MQHDVFISHALKDKSIADAICAKLEAAEVKCWIAAPDIAAGEDWTAATRSAIESSRVVVLLLSENSHAAPHIEREIAHAFYARRTILTFRLAGTIPPRALLFYLGNVPWINAVSPPSEKQLEALTARIKGLLSRSTVIPSQGAGKTTPQLTFSNSWLGALQASHYRTLGILKWAAITACFFAGFWLLWLAFRPAQEQVGPAESRLRPTSQVLNASPKSSPSPAGGNASASTPTYAFTRFGLWQPANPDPKPLAQPGSQDASPATPAEQTPGVAPSARTEVTPGEQAGVPAEPQTSPATSARMHRAPRRHHSPSQVAEAGETQGDGSPATGRRDALRHRLKELEAKAKTAQKKAELASRQREALAAQLRQVKERAQRAERHADLAARQHGALEAELKAAQEKAQLAQQNANLAASQRSALEAELRKAQEEKAQLAQHVADLAAFGKSAATPPSQEAPEEAEPADGDADLSANKLESGQTQPPNPGQNAKTPPLIQALNSSIPSTRP
jgi:hypothetical protein